MQLDGVVVRFYFGSHLLTLLLALLVGGVAGWKARGWRGR